MRDFKGMKRSRSRNRRSGGSQQGQNNNPNRSFDSSGPEGIKVRGNAQTVYERYQQLARDATTSGDRILAENYLQHAEHYFRLLRIMQPNRPVSEIAAREGANAGFDIDFEDESGTQFTQTPQPAQPEATENAPAQHQEAEAPAGDRSGGDRPASDRPAGDRPEGEGQGGRRETRRERYERRRQERWSNEGGEDQAENSEQAAASDPLPVIEPASAGSDRDADAPEAHMPSFLTRAAPVAAPASGEDESEAPAPRRRTRARKPAADAAPDGES